MILSKRLDIDGSSNGKKPASITNRMTPEGEPRAPRVWSRLRGRWSRSALLFFVLLPRRHCALASLAIAPRG
eukprot:5075482-Prymnesium_polylepis.1